MGAQASRVYPIVRALVAAGHKVAVVTGMPNYPTGIVLQQYRGKHFIREDRDGFTVLRTAYYTTARNRSRWAQLFSYLSFIPAAFHSGLRAGPIDLVFVTSPPIFSVLPAIWLSRLRRAKLVVDVRDLWPDEMIACGATSKGSLSERLITAIERCSYRAADCVCCTTQSFVETVVARGTEVAKVLLIPNGADLTLFRVLPVCKDIVGKYSLGDRFVVLYSGVLGIKHGLEVIEEAANILSNKKDIVFLIVGGGARHEPLRQRAMKMGLHNMIFAGQQKIEDVPALIARADICLSALLPEPYFGKIITVKVFEYMACERPVVAAVAGETARVLNESGAGIVVAPGDAYAMSEAICQLYADPERRLAMGKRGRRYVEQNYSRATWAVHLETALSNLVRHNFVM